MNGADRRTALAALAQARPAIQRLDVDRHPEDVAADLIEGWSAVETALRSLLGGSALSGQPLVHELRQRQLISIDQAHSLVRFLDARTRASRTDYRPTQADCDAAREAFASLERGLAVPDSMAGAPAGAPAAAPAVAAPGEPLAATVPPARPVRRRSPWLAVAIAIVLLAAVGAGLWFAMRPSTYDTAMANGRELYRRGSLNAAVGEFTRAARAEPNEAAPHIYLGRIARDQGDLATATRELTTAVERGPRNPDALREMGSLQLVRGDNNLARNFYVRAIQASSADRQAMGYLACALARLGRAAEAQTWLQRAGDGPWAACVVPLLQGATAQPGAAIPR